MYPRKYSRAMHGRVVYQRAGAGVLRKAGQCWHNHRRKRDLPALAGNQAAPQGDGRQVDPGVLLPLAHEGKFFHGNTPASLELVPEFSGDFERDRKSTRLNSSHSSISYAVFCLKKKNVTRTNVLSV